MKSDPHFPIVIYFDFAKSSLSNKSIVHVSIYINIGTISQSVCHIPSVHFPFKFGRIEKLWKRLKVEELPAGPKILRALAT